MKNKLITLLLCLFSLPVIASQNFPRHDPVPGGIAIVDLATSEKPRQVLFNQQRVLIRKSNTGWQAIVGIPLTTAAGIHQLQVQGQQTVHQAFEVKDKDYETRHLTIKNKRMVSPNKQDIDRHGREKPLILAALKTWTDQEQVATAFVSPVQGPFSSPFGLRRIYNNQDRIRRHTGLDIAAPVGTEIVAPAAGRVIRTGNYFFTGGTVFIDHGQGLVTMYCHMDKIDVQAGADLQQGQHVGTVGMTGRVSGAHLHWVVSLNNTKGEPRLFLPQD